MWNALDKQSTYSAAGIEQQILFLVQNKCFFTDMPKFQGWAQMEFKKWMVVTQVVLL